MKICFYSVKEYEKVYLERENVDHQIKLLSAKLDNETVSEAESYDAISIFAKDNCDEKILSILNDIGIKFIALRSAGYDNIDIKVAQDYGIKVARVPSYSPEAIAEHAILLILALSRHLYAGQVRLRNYNFHLRDMMGFNIHGKKIGVIGTGNIGKAFIRILNGFGANVIAYDMNPDYTLYDSLSFEYTDIVSLLQSSDIISLHIPYNETNYHFIDIAEMDHMRPDTIIINTSRGHLINTEMALKYLDSGQLGGLGLDVYENEEPYFFEDHSDKVMTDVCLKKLINHDKVILTGHQAFLTTTAISNIASITYNNIDSYEKGENNENFIC